ncbi:MAG: hypothetical protein R3E10_07170 [Gemmatimonadota bacterium]
MEARERADSAAPKRVIELSRDHVWPVAIAIGLLLVALVNVTFIYIAVTGADEVVPSYVSGPR